MFQQIQNWFLKPYPFPTTTKQKILISLGFGKFVFLFLLLFKPFGFHELANQTLYYSFIYGLITAVLMMLFFIISPLIFSKFFNPSKWVIYKMLLFVFLIVIAVSFFNWMYSVNYLPQTVNSSDHTVLFFLSSTMLIGVFPILIYLYISENIHNKRHKKIAHSITDSNNSIPKKEVVNSGNITLLGENKEESLTISFESFLYINSEKNYASVFYTEKNEIKESLLRVSLAKLEEQLSDYKSIIRCHKSYLVNTSKVKEIKGNARSYLLRIPCDKKEILIPVSRSFPKELLFTLVG